MPATPPNPNQGGNLAAQIAAIQGLGNAIPNPNAPPLSVQLSDSNAPSQVIQNMLGRFGAGPELPPDPSEAPNFWEGVGQQSASVIKPRKQKMGEDRSTNPSYGGY